MVALIISDARTLTILAACIGGFCFAVPFPGNAGVYKIQVLGDHRAIRVGHWDSLAWLDEKRLLFAAYDPRQPAALPNLYEWDLESDQVRVVYDLAGPNFCLSADKYTYSRMWRNGEQFQREGFFGSETERPFAPVYRDPLLCRPTPSIEQRPPKRQGSTRSLLPGHGYLEISPKNVWYYPVSGHAGMELPIPAQEAGFYLWFRFSAFANSYVLRRLETIERKGMAGVVWLMGLDGSVTRIVVPPGPWIVGKHYFPTRAGMYFSSTMPGLSSRKQPGDSGGYLLKDHSVKRLFAGFVQVADVAPDGCRIAAVVDPYTTWITHREIYVVNVCD